MLLHLGLGPWDRTKMPRGLDLRCGIPNLAQRLQFLLLNHIREAGNAQRVDDLFGWVTYVMVGYMVTVLYYLSCALISCSFLLFGVMPVFFARSLRGLNGPQFCNRMGT